MKLIATRKLSIRICDKVDFALPIYCYEENAIINNHGHNTKTQKKNLFTLNYKKFLATQQLFRRNSKKMSVHLIIAHLFSSDGNNRSSGITTLSTNPLLNKDLGTADWPWKSLHLDQTIFQTHHRLQTYWCQHHSCGNFPMAGPR